MNRRQFIKTAVCAGTATLAGLVITGSQYTDVPGFDDRAQPGRSKNSIAAVVAGIVGQKLYGYSSIELNIEKSYFPDAKVTGNTTPDSVDTYVNLLLTGVHFEGKRNVNGQLEGEAHKSEFNWKVKQTSENRYEISRWGPKFDGALELTVKDGKIAGTYIRGGPAFNWNIAGTYDNLGNVHCTIDGRLSLGITLDGKISPK